MKIWQFIQENFLEIMSSIGAFFALLRTKKKLTPEERKQKKIRRLETKTAKLIAKTEKSADKLENTLDKESK